MMEKDKMNIVLYGNDDCGKTTTLFELAMLLVSGESSPSSSLVRQINNQFQNKGKYIDTHFILKYRDKTIYICTGGDSWVMCKSNYDFFNGIFNSQFVIFSIDENGIGKISLTEKEVIKKQTPDICISACRINDEKYGAMQSIHHYNESFLDCLTCQLWIHQPKEEENNEVQVKKRNINMAKKIVNIIDGSINNLFK